MSNKMFDQGFQMGLAAGKLIQAAPTTTIEARYFEAEHDFHPAVALLETLGVLIEADFTSVDDVDVEALNRLAVQYAAAMERLSAARNTLFGLETGDKLQ